MTDMKSLMEISDAAYFGDERIVVEYFQQRPNLREDDIGITLLAAAVAGYKQNKEFVSPDASTNVRKKVLLRITRAFVEAGLEVNSELPFSDRAMALLNDINQEVPEVIDIMYKAEEQRAREANGLLVLNEDGLYADDILPKAQLSDWLLVGDRVVKPVNELS